LFFPQPEVFFIITYGYMNHRAILPAPLSFSILKYTNESARLQDKDGGGPGFSLRGQNQHIRKSKTGLPPKAETVTMKVTKMRRGMAMS
ncbi:MAG: hypothetical protein K2P30_14285, partial [Lachnospiraceae bacterium]|nr:hypothetical protein [Lachnospiraceae bacterium]